MSTAVLAEKCCLFHSHPLNAGVCIYENLDEDNVDGHTDIQDVKQGNMDPQTTNHHEWEQSSDVGCEILADRVRSDSETPDISSTSNVSTRLQATEI